MASEAKLRQYLDAPSDRIPVGKVYANMTDYAEPTPMHKLRRDKDGIWRSWCSPSNEATYSYVGRRSVLTCGMCKRMKEPKEQ